MTPSIIISHRGNLNGPNPPRENSWNYILEALFYHPQLYVEIDIWQSGSLEPLYLGHDHPQYEINIWELRKYRNRLVCHAKTVHALQTLVESGLHSFYHHNDSVVLTSKRWLWIYPTAQIVSTGIWVLPETIIDLDKDKIECRGICTDYPAKFIDKL